MKSSRQSLPRDVAIPDRYTSFFSFPLVKGGYSGVAVYSKSSTAVPLKAEEGLSGKLQPKPPLTLEERVSSSYPDVDDIDPFPDEEGNTPSTFDALDAEGRGLVVDFGLFVLINVYCPNETSDARLSFKMNYHLLLQERVRKLVEEEHREVIVLGDINICATPLDHCDGHLPSNASTFFDHPARAWFHKWLAPNGPMVDVVRSFWPERKGLFTCKCFLVPLAWVSFIKVLLGWNTKISARETNYGTRVDYILVTRGLLKWIKHGDIQASLKGSDHCPIYIDLYDELRSESGEVIRLRDALKQSGGPQPPPRIATANWEEFSGKQTLLSSFFGRTTEANEKGRTIDGTVKKNPLFKARISPPVRTTGEESVGPVDKRKSPPPAARPSIRPSASSSSSKKRSHPQLSSSTDTGSTSKKRKKSERGQATLGAFFAKPKARTEPKFSSEVIEEDDNADPDPDPDPVSGSSAAPSSPSEDVLDQLNADYRLALELSASQESASESLSSQSTAESSSKKVAWSNLFTPAPPPKCTAHGEPAKKFTVNKPGPNKGRSFYVCSR
ncbi:hypothetical protein NM688_g7341 [Phlebia brevispora]|uniref:Uncharacterized protein n=1 Tax=Phlebia brevispora TaxID=194682 RepID=A0ACC1S6D5_9APHY|nr:hypothetical protein NM688_g7341 [Phlebia brevispora]